jgi:hypothetical protein
MVMCEALLLLKPSWRRTISILRVRTTNQGGVQTSLGVNAGHSVHVLFVERCRQRGSRERPT